MSAPLRVALVGYGLAGSVFHAPLITATQGMILQTVVSSDPAKVLAGLPGVLVVAELGNVLADPSIDLVVLATPDHLHPEHALAALAAGKHVVIDKPLAPQLDDSRRIVAAAAASGKIMAVFHNRRWDADFLTIQRLIVAGELGEIVQFDSHFDRYRPAVGSRWKDRREGGLWQDLGPHLVDQALVLFGMPQGVYADFAAQRHDTQAPDYAHVVLRYGQHRVILHASQSTHDGGLRFAVHGSRGSYVKHGLDSQEDQSKAGMLPGDADWGIDRLPGLLTRAGTGQSEVNPIVSERGDYLQFYVELLGAIQGRSENPVPPEQALDVMIVLDACLASAGERREIVIDG